LCILYIVPKKKKSQFHGLFNYLNINLGGRERSWWSFQLFEEWYLLGGKGVGRGKILAQSCQDILFEKMFF
jgi:hypothetical protein